MRWYKGTQVNKYYYAGSQRIAMRDNGMLFYLLGDHLGSTSPVTFGNGNVVSEMKYKAWGEVRFGSGSMPIYLFRLLLSQIQQFRSSFRKSHCETGDCFANYARNDIGISVTFVKGNTRIPDVRIRIMVRPET